MSILLPLHYRASPDVILTAVVRLTRNSAANRAESLQPERLAQVAQFDKSPGTYSGVDPSAQQSVFRKVSQTMPLPEQPGTPASAAAPLRNPAPPTVIIQQPGGFF